nr:MAG TPA: TRAF PROTEIN, TRAO PROTEIN, TRAN ADHESION, BACTERIAL SECRETION.5A [Caudoviricetes sp.]
MKKVLLLLVGLIALGCSKGEDKGTPQKTNDPDKEQQIQQEQKRKANEQNKKEALIYFTLAKTSLNNQLNKNKELDFWTNTLKALEVSKGNEDVYKEVDDFLKNNRFATPRWLDSQQSEINNLIDKLNNQDSIINKYSSIKSAIDLFNQWKN